MMEDFISCHSKQWWSRHDQKQFMEKVFYFIYFPHQSPWLKEVRAVTQTRQEPRSMDWTETMERYWLLYFSVWLTSLYSYTNKYYLPKAQSYTYDIFIGVKFVFKYVNFFKKNLWWRRKFTITMWKRKARVRDIWESHNFEHKWREEREKEREKIGASASRPKEEG